MCSDLPHQLDCAPLVEKMDFVGELLHQEYTPATLSFNPLLAGRIGKLEVIKTTSLVRDDKLDLVFLFMTGDVYFFPGIQLVAMDHRVVDGFRQADEDVGIQIFIDMQTLYHVSDEDFNFADTTWM